jgi:hypothetical protein
MNQKNSSHLCSRVIKCLPLAISMLFILKLPENTIAVVEVVPGSALVDNLFPRVLFLVSKVLLPSLHKLHLL